MTEMTTKTVTKQTIRNERQPGGDIAEVVKTYIALHPTKFKPYREHEADTKLILGMSKRGMDPETAEAIAWFIWRARMVLNWSRNDKREDTVTWDEACDSAYLKDELFKLCSDKRKAFYAAQERRRNVMTEKAFKREAKARRIDGDRSDEARGNEQAALEHETQRAGEQQTTATAANAA